MRTFFLINKDHTWTAWGGYSQCIALAHQYCDEHPDDEVYLLKGRGEERAARYIISITKSQFLPMHPPKFLKQSHLRSLQKRLRE